ncbi:MAG: HDIG domain-containing metalloprotein [Thermacetogeniaceae bacterium]
MITWKKWGSWLQHRWQRLTHRRGFRMGGIIVIFLLIAATTVGSGLIGRGYSLQEGQISPFDLRAPRTMAYVDEPETERARQEAASRVENVYQRDDQVPQQGDTKLQGIFDEIRALNQQNLSSQRSGSLLQDYLIQATGASDKEFSSQIAGSLNALLSLSGNQLTKVYGFSKSLLDDSFKYGLTEDALPTARDNLAGEVASSNLSRDLQPGVSFLLTHILRPDLVLDRTTYARKVAEARESVAPVQRWIQAGQMIIQKGEPIDSNHLAELQQLGLLRTRNIWPSLFGVIFLVLLLAGLTAAYLKKFKPRFYGQEQYIVLYGILFSLTLLAAKGVTLIRLGSQAETTGLIGYLAPLAGGAMLITVLMDAGLAVFTSFILSLLLGVMLDGQISFVVAGLAGSLAGIYCVSSLSDRAGLIRGGAFVSAVNAVAIFVMGLLNGPDVSTVLKGMGLGVANGFLSSILMLGFLPYLESLFSITSSVRLLELANPNEPVLKRLLVEAPGTYHHSILVGNLAEAAAQAVQADPLLVRVGAYYHDIGKLKRPYFFIENQVTRDSPHEKIAPSLSTLIITSHVKDGLEQARELKLPTSVQAIIEQHHGTGLVAYFYQRALESDRPELVAEADFRYDNVKPQTKEAALVMLADSVEAAVRSLQKPTPGRLEGLARKIIKERLNDGQLDECDLTFKDLNTIAVAFVKVLGGIFHSRIEYPETMIAEIERRRVRGAVINQ